MFVFAGYKLDPTTRVFFDYWIWNATHQSWDWVCRSPVFSAENPAFPGCPTPPCILPATAGPFGDFENYCGAGMLSLHTGKFMGEQAWRYTASTGWNQGYFAHWRLP